jgi:hypothetical protein
MGFLLRIILSWLAERLGMELIRRDALIEERRKGREEGRAEALLIMHRHIEDSIREDGHVPTAAEMDRLFGGAQ